MTDSTSGPPAPPAAGPAPGQIAPGQIAIAINAQYLKDLSFENPRAPMSLAPGAGGAQPQVQVNVDVGARPLGQDLYEVTLAINAEAKTGVEVTFVVEVSYAGLFTVQGVPQDQLGAVLLIEGPRLLFPFARQIVADATSAGGFPPLLIAPIDFAQLYVRRAAAAAATPSPGAGAAPASAPHPSPVPSPVPNPSSGGPTFA